MRIINGLYRRRRFQIPASFKARPTTDFAKESLFNVLSHLIDWEGAYALDLFAGTGSISFELISRGCRCVTAVEQDRAHVAFITKVANELKTKSLSLIKGDALYFLNRAMPQSFDFIFADPPYSLGKITEIPQLVFDNNILRKGGVFVIEHSKANDFSTFPFFDQRRNYGSVNFSFFVRT